ncbi:MAG: tetratricopeptide repeat protein [Acidobacteria bacterium]|nr:tetratricopeptide repeat protein [Acidobacteriota bacterium]
MRMRTIAIAAACAAAPGCLTAALADDAGKIRSEFFERLNSGTRALRAGDAQQAVKDLCWAAAHGLNSHQAALQCGLARLAARDPEGAVRSLEIAADLEPRDLGTQVGLGDAYLAAGRLDQARASYYRALEIRPDHSPAWDGLARVAQQSNDDKTALENFAKALQANAADARARLHRGYFHLDRGRLTEALDDIREAARLRPDDAEVQLGLARVLLQSRALDASLAAARRAREMQPRDARAPALMAEVFLALDALPEAEESARAALELDPGLARPRIALAGALARTGRLDEAIAVLQPPPGRSALDQLEAQQIAEARALWEKRRAELAQLAQQADAPEATPETKLALAETLLATGRADDAATLAAAALAAAPGDPASLRRAALVLAGSGHLLAGAGALEALGRLGPLSPADLVNLGVLREQTGDAQGAAAAYRQALESPGAPEAAHAGLARLALARGDRDEAARELKALLGGEPSADDARIKEALARLEVKP